MTVLMTPETEVNDVYRLIVERSPDVIMIIQHEQPCYCNLAATTILGYTPEELHGLPISRLLAPDQPQALANINKLLKGSLDSFQASVNFIHKNGQMISLHTVCAPLTYNGAAAVLLAGRAMKEQQQEQAHLIQSAKAAAIARFVSALAHELNNPLTVIVGFSEILLSHLTLDEQDQSDLQMIASEANRARRMIHDVLALSRNQAPRKQIVDLNALVMTTLEGQREALRACGIEVVVELAADLPTIMADAAQLEEMLTHLLTWFRKPLGRDTTGGRLRLRTCLKQPHGQFVQVLLVDHRSGRYSGDLNQFFEPVYRTREEDKGLGLALAYNVIRQHGGTARLAYQPDGGLTLTIELPVNESAALSGLAEASA